MSWSEPGSSSIWSQQSRQQKRHHLRKGLSSHEGRTAPISPVISIDIDVWALTSLRSASWQQGKEHHAITHDEDIVFLLHNHAQVLRGSSASGIHHGQAWSILDLISGAWVLFLLPPCPEESWMLLIFREWHLYTRFRNRIDQFILLVVFPGWTRRRSESLWLGALGGAFRCNPREGCQWLSLASCTHDQDFIVAA